MSLKAGCGAMAALRKSPDGCSPSGPSCMQMVPPVPMMSTRDSGRPDSPLLNTFVRGAPDMLEMLKSLCCRWS